MVEPSETSPLLAAEESQGEASRAGDDIVSFPEVESYTPASEYYKRPIKIITFRILIIAILSFIVLLTAAIFVNYAPFKSVPYNTSQLITASGAFVLLAFIVALIDLRVQLRFLFIFLINLFLLWILPTWLPVGPPEYSFPDYSWCKARWSDDPIQPACLNYILPAKILMGIGFGLAFIIWLLLLVLLVMRCIAAWKSAVWRRPSGFMIPTGELTFQFTIKLLRQETGAVVPEAGAGVISTQQGTREGAQ